MEAERREFSIPYNVHWVTDPEGKRHLFHDRLAAQLTEEAIKRAVKEAEQGGVHKG